MNHYSIAYSTAKNVNKYCHHYYKRGRFAIKKYKLNDLQIYSNSEAKTNYAVKGIKTYA
jgi:hypothetical protein